MEPTIGRKSTRQRQMEFNNLVSIKGQKKYGDTDFSESFCRVFSYSFQKFIQSCDYLIGSRPPDFT